MPGRARAASALVISAALLCSCASTRGRVSIGAGNQFPLHPLFQQWLLIDDQAPLRTLEGTVERIAINRGDPFDDGDWNIEIRPVARDEHLLLNRAGGRNANGEVELEVRTVYPEQGVDLFRLFPVGTPVSAYGFWVEDSGHRSKTELHPLIALQSLGPQTAVLVAQDLTGRFVVSRREQSYSFRIPLQVTPATIDLTTGESRPGSAVIVTEESVVDYRPPAAAALPGLRGTSVVRTQRPGVTEIAVRVPGVEEPQRRAGFVPFYVGTFATGAATLIAGSAELTKENTAGGRPYLSLKAKASLSLPSGLPAPEEVVWLSAPEPDASAGAFPQESERRGGLELETRFRYAPAEGETDSAWTIVAFGATARDEKGVSARFEARQTYIVEPSSVALEQSASDLARAIRLRAAVRRAHAELAYRLDWSIAAGGEQLVVPPGGGSVELSGVTARWIGTEQLEVVFGESAPLRATITVQGETDIGEELSTSLEIVRPDETGRDGNGGAS